jgi:hypothetical protein
MTNTSQEEQAELEKELHDYMLHLLYLERRAYLAAVQAAVSGLESARVVLAKVRQRIEGDRRRGPE